MKLAVLGKNDSVILTIGVERSRPDCLSALATVAQQPGYVKPQFFDDDRLDVGKP
jgi:DNA mismatch repair ATPase MutS